MKISPSPVVFVTDEVPQPGRAGHLAVNHAIVDFLASRGLPVVVFLSRPRLPWPFQRFGRVLDPAHVRVEGPRLISGRGWVAAMPWPSARILLRRGLELVPAGFRNRLRQKALAKDYGAVDVVIGRFIEPAAVTWSIDRIAELKPRAILVDTIFRAPLLQHPSVAKIRSFLITHDVMYRRHDALSARGLRVFPAGLSQAQEVDLLALATVVVAIQPEEQRLLQGLLPHKEVICAPMAAQPRPRPANTMRETGLLAYVGSESAHNVDGLRWFLAEVWPRIRAALPSARLEVCGKVCSALALRTVPEGVVLRGLVPDLGTVLHRAAVAVAPVIAGTGLKIKLLDYVAHGLTVVTTDVGVEGFEQTPHWPFIVAATAEEFAAISVQQAEDLADIAAREQRALDYCLLYTPERVLSTLAEAIERP